MKIAMANIIKNELKFLPTYLERNKDVDYICLLDTGSTDGSWEYLQEQAQLNPKLIIQQKLYEDFTFDVAKNDALTLVPDDTDIIVLLDIDEWFQEENWVDIVREQLQVDGKRHFYSTPYVDHSTYSITGYPRITIVARIIQTKHIKYFFPVHEILSADDWDRLGNRGRENIWWNQLIIQHTPDTSKDRSNYIPLCLRRINTILPVEYDIEGEKIGSYGLLAHEYYRAGMYEQAVRVYNEHLMQDNDAKYDFSPNMYLITRDIQYIRNAISILEYEWYDQNVLYYALKDDLDWCRQYKDVILQKINHYDHEFPERYHEEDILGNMIKEMAKLL